MSRTKSGLPAFEIAQSPIDPYRLVAFFLDSHRRRKHDDHSYQIFRPHLGGCLVGFLPLPHQDGPKTRTPLITYLAELFCLLPWAILRPNCAMSKFTIHPLISDSDWQEALAIRAQLHPEFPVSRAEYESEDRMFDGKVLYRNVIKHGEKIVGMIIFAEAFWYSDPNGFTGRVAALPDDLEVFDFGFKHLLELGERHKAQKIHSGIEDRYPKITVMAESYGWKTKMAQKVSRLNLCDFNQAAGELDYEILSLPELKVRKPDSWLQEYWRLDMDLLKDVPMTGEFVEDTIEFFEKFMDHPGFCHEGLLFAVMPDGALAGTTSLSPSLVDPKVGITALTGVRREYRRRGIAKALKTRSLLWGREQGIEFVMTDNEEKNPMYLLNEELGFRYVFSQLAMVWERSSISG